jgi:SAM-dependent methyltransferase
LKASRDLFYRCVRCSSSLVECEDKSLACDVCHAQYPIIGKVRGLTFKPNRLLRAQAGRVNERYREVAKLKSDLEETGGAGHSPEALSQALRGYDRWLADLDLLEQLMQPVRDYLVSQPPPGNPLDDFLLESGWPSFRMLPYFYRDWAGTAEATFVTDLFTRAIEKYCGDRRGGVAVLGCGAGRLAYDFSDLFPAVFGVELAVDSLLLAQALLDGAEVDLHFNFPYPHIPIDQPTVRLKGPARRAGNIELAAADVSRLPFSSGSLQCVTTQYLLDVVTSPDSVYREIHRVLAPGGLWINFSNLSENNSPPEVRPFDQLNNLGLSGFFRRYGFNLLEEAVHRFSLLDLSALSKWAPANLETPVFFVARKEDGPGLEATDEVAAFFAGRSDRVWTMVPKIATPIQVVRSRSFTGQGVDEVTRLEIFQASRPVDPEMALLSEGLLQMIDGTRTLGEIFGALQANYGDLIPDDDFLTLFCELADLRLITLFPA